MLRYSYKRYLKAPFQRRHWRAAFAIPRHVEHPVAFLARYVAGVGSYPATVTVRTPAGPLPLEVYSPHDVSTINEIFCRGDYCVDDSISTVVDIGANIGISAAYFLSRNPGARVWCYEPAPANLPRLREQLARFGDRVRIEEVAVGVEDADLDFGIEPTGRYGTLWASEYEDSVVVHCREINGVLEEVLEHVPRIDVLKVDIEGWEPQVIGAIRADLAARIGLMIYEFDRPIPAHLEAFEHVFDGNVNRLTAR